jgi:hypothetical protein
MPFGGWCWVRIVGACPLPHREFLSYTLALPLSMLVFFGVAGGIGVAVTFVIVALLVGSWAWLVFTSDPCWCSHGCSVCSSIGSIALVKKKRRNIQIGVKRLWSLSPGLFCSCPCLALFGLAGLHWVISRGIGTRPVVVVKY